MFTFPLFLWIEFYDFVDYVSVHADQCVYVIAGTSVLAFAYNWSHLALIALTGPVYSGVTGCFKVILLIVCSQAFDPKAVDMLVYNWIGIACATLLFSVATAVKVMGLEHPRAIEPDYSDELSRELDDVNPTVRYPDPDARDEERDDQNLLGSRSDEEEK